MLQALAAISAVIASLVSWANARILRRMSASSFSWPNHAWRAATFRESNVSARLAADTFARNGIASRVRPADW